MTSHFPIIEKAYINDLWIDAENKIEVFNPATKQLIGTIPNLGAKETKEAIDAASTAFPKWAALTVLARADILFKWYALIMENQVSLAKLISLEGGKSHAEAMGEVAYGASFIRWFAEEIRRSNGDVIESDIPSKRFFVIKQPVGVVGAITPWNFPLAMITRKCAPAFAAGCTVVLKPSELTPFSAIALAALSKEAGLPKGIFNVITGDAKPIGDSLCEDIRIRKISFTGSTKVGQYLAKQSAPTVKRLSLELGGNAPFIIFSDADIDKSIQEILVAKFRNNGQTCICANRILVERSILSEVKSKLIAAVKSLKVGHAFADESVQLGPLINQAGLDKVQRLVEDAIQQGAECLLGGKPLNLGGYFFEPTILANIQSTMQIAHEEIFGPVIALHSFDTEEEAIALANDTNAGLASYVFTKNIGRLWRVMEKLEYGMVGGNTGFLSNTAAPFGGVKFSGYGREGSKYGLEDFQVIKSFCLSVE